MDDVRQGKIRCVCHINIGLSSWEGGGGGGRE